MNFDIWSAPSRLAALGSDFWTMVGALAAVGQLVVIAITFWLALRQLRELVNVRQMEAIFKIWDEINSDPVDSARRYIMDNAANLPKPDEMIRPRANGFDVVPQHKELHRYIFRVSSAYDKIGVIVKHRIASEDVVFEMYPSIPRWWDTIGPYIEEQQKYRGAKYHDHFRYLNERCREHMKLRASPVLQGSDPT